VSVEVMNVKYVVSNNNNNNNKYNDNRIMIIMIMIIIIIITLLILSYTDCKAVAERKHVKKDFNIWT